MTYQNEMDAEKLEKLQKLQTDLAGLETICIGEEQKLKGDYWRLVLGDQKLAYVSNLYRIHINFEYEYLFSLSSEEVANYLKAALLWYLAGLEQGVNLAKRQAAAEIEGIYSLPKELLALELVKASVEKIYTQPPKESIEEALYGKPAPAYINAPEPPLEDSPLGEKEEGKTSRGRGTRSRSKAQATTRETKKKTGAAKAPAKVTQIKVNKDKVQEVS